jgi:hypothetical protein
MQNDFNIFLSLSREDRIAYIALNVITRVVHYLAFCAMNIENFTQ